MLFSGPIGKQRRIFPGEKAMCVAIPMKIVRLLPDKQAVVSYEGVERQVSLRLMENCQEGDYVLLHAGYAIERLSPEAAEENIRSFAAMRKELGLE